MQKVIAIDFDGCLCENRYPEIGAPCWPVIDLAKRRQKDGWALVLWTSRCGADLDAAKAACAEWGLRFDAVNENLPEWSEIYKNDTRKIGATEYWDDKAVLMPANAYNTTAADAAMYYQEWASGDAAAHVSDDLAAYRAAAAQALQDQARRAEWAGTLFEQITRNPWELAEWLAWNAANFPPCEMCALNNSVSCVPGTECKAGIYMVLTGHAPEGRSTEPAKAETDNAPLTLEELREMDGEPVWIARPCGIHGNWTLVDAKDEVCQTVRGEIALFDGYGAHWLAYRRKPVQGGTNESL